MTMKTPEEMAAQYATAEENQHMIEAPRSNSVLYHSFLAGYQAAQEHAHAALEEAKAEIASLRERLADITWELEEEE